MDLSALTADLPELFLLGITGPPGVGKSTFAAALAERTHATVVPMDGFHLPDAELHRRGLLDRKGAPETFDALAYAALLGELRAHPRPPVPAPGFDRELEEPVARAVTVPVGPVVTEGNYLLLDFPEWRAVRAHLDRVWHLTCDPEVRRERLVARHVQFGKTPAQARAWVKRVDEPNAALVEAAAAAADRVVDVTCWTA